MKVTKQQICKIAIGMFRDRGYASVSVENICEQCSVTRGSFYHYFKNKDDLLLFWFDEYAKNMTSFEASEPCLSPKERLRAYLEAYAEGISRPGHELLYHTAIADFTLKKNIFITSALEDNAYSKVSDVVLPLIRCAQAEGTVNRDVNAERLLATHSYAMTGLVFQWKLSDGQVDFMSEMRTLFEIIFQ